MEFWHDLHSIVDFAFTHKYFEHSCVNVYFLEILSRLTPWRIVPAL